MRGLSLFFILIWTTAALAKILREQLVDDARVPDLLRVEENVPDQQERNQTGFCGVGSSGAPDCATHQIQEVNNCTDSASSLKNLFEEFLVSQRQRNIETDQKLKKLEEYLFVILD